MAETKDDRELARTKTATLDRSMDDQPRSEVIRRDIESTRAALDEKLEALQTKVRDVGTKAKQTLDVRHHVAEHPWAMLGASVATGFVAGMMTGGGEEESEQNQRMIGWHSTPSASYQAQPAFSSPAPPVPPAPRERTPRSDLFETLKLAAGAALTDAVRQALHKYVPAFGEQLDRVWKERGLTPTTAAHAFFSGRQRGEDRTD